MQKLNIKEHIKDIERLKPNPLFKGLPDRLKNPKNFLETENKLIEVVKTDHNHKTVKQYVKCLDCQVKFRAKQKLMKELGFSSVQQHAEWRKIMIIMTSKKDFQL